MSLTVTLIAKLSGVDENMARRACDTAAAFDGMNMSPPEEFASGAGARCYALAAIAEYRPPLFWGGLAALIVVPILIVVRVLHHG
jgi:hypothetical protein